MIKFLKTLIATLIAMPALTKATEQGINIMNGSFKLSNTVLTEKIKMNGDANLGPNTLVKDVVIVNGSLNAENVTFEGDLTVNGSAKISQVKLNSNAEFSGSLIANDCEASKKIIILSQKTDFSNCQLQDVVIKKNSYINSKQIIHLKNNTNVHGDITFESGRGEVYADATSKVYGQVRGGDYAGK